MYFKFLLHFNEYICIFTLDFEIVEGSELEEQNLFFCAMTC